MNEDLINLSKQTKAGSEGGSPIKSGSFAAAAYPAVHKVALEEQIDSEHLIRIFEMEKQFHRKLLATDDPGERRTQYKVLYNEVHRLKQMGATADLPEDTTTHSRLVLTFRREIEGKSVLDLGCGTGVFLRTIDRLLAHGDLCGIDTSAAHLPGADRSIRFIQSDIITFQLDTRFQVVFSHQVLEHIAPADLRAHFSSIRAALEEDGKLILCLPNRYWGPQDITRIVDNTFRGKVPAMGSHVNESSYSELVPMLESLEFTNIRTVLPLAAFVPFLRGYRVRPRFNQTVEKQPWLRSLLNLFRLRGKPVFKNPILLICDKGSAERQESPEPRRTAERTRNSAHAL